MRFTLKKYDKVLFVFFAAALLASFLIWTFEERFDENTWRNNITKRYTMTDDIIDSELLIGKSKDEVIELLGIPYMTNHNGNDNIVYRLGKSPSFSKPKEDNLIIIFENAVVVEVIHIKE